MTEPFGSGRRSLVIASIDLPGRLTLSYVERGDPDGTPVVFLHGIGDSWRAFENVLVSLPCEIRALVPSQRGHGDSGSPPSGYHPGDFADDLLAFLDGVGVERAVLVGGSSGGLAARRFAIDHPERTLGLALLGSPASLKDKPVVLEMWHTTISKLNDPLDPEFVRGFFQATTAEQRIPASLVETLIEESMKVPAHVYRQTYLGLLQDDSEDELESIAAPTLVVWGDRDALLTRSDQDRLVTAIPRACLLVYEGAGHPFYWEEPERVACDLAAFVELVLAGEESQ